MIPWQAISVLNLTASAYIIWVCLAAPWLKGWNNWLLVAAAIGLIVVEFGRLLAWRLKRNSPT